MSARFMDSATCESDTELSDVATGIDSRRSARVSSSRPVSMASSRRSLENHWRILLRARDEVTKPSQSREGPAAAAFEVKISTVSALASRVSSGTSRPLTLAPMHRCPTSVWMA